MLLNYTSEYSTRFIEIRLFIPPTAQTARVRYCVVPRFTELLPSHKRDLNTERYLDHTAGEYDS